MMTYNMIKICMLALFLHSLQCTPTDQPTPNIDLDAVKLKKAMKGFGTDKAAIVNVVVNRSNAQRQEIRKAFKKHFQKDLIEELKSELTGDFEVAVVGLMLTNQEFFAKELNDALTGLGTDEKAITEILGSLNRSEVETISTIYERVYRRRLKDDIIDDTEGSFQNLLVKLCNTNREYYEEVDTVNATSISRNLILAGFDSMDQENFDKEEEALVSILTTRSVAQIKKIFEEYTKIKKKSIIETIKGRFSDTMEFALSTLIRCAISKNEYFADQLNDAIEGIGTNDRQLIRIIVGRSEIDLKEIKKSYESKYKSSLVDKVADETSGDYKDLLVAILNK